MRINTNVAALNSYNQLKNTQNNLSKSLSRLSSGKRINGAADDAAGLAISEKMNSQTKGLAMAQRNAQDGISMIQTAEGALKETHSILQRMRELSVQSANDTNTSDDRAEIQKEVDQLASELTRIGDTTEFNTQSLLDGTLKDIKFQIGANDGQNMSVSVNDMRADSLGVAGDTAGVEVGEKDVVSTSGSINTSTANTAFETGGEFTVNKLDETVTVQNAAAADMEAGYSITNDAGNIVGLISEDGRDMTVAGTGAAVSDISSFTASADATFANGLAVTEGTLTVDNNATATITASESTLALSEDANLEAGSYTFVDSSQSNLLDSGFGLFTSDGQQVAASADASSWQDMDTNSLFDLASADLATVAGLEHGDTVSFKGDGGIDVSTQSAANNAISTLDDAIASVSGERSKLGAIQNRLDHTINNLNTAEENLTAAESRISDVDMAKEMMNMSKQQILSQAGTAMMAQANQLPQGVLQLLG